MERTRRKYCEDCLGLLYPYLACPSCMCTQSFSDYDRKNVNLCCVATVTKATEPYAPVFQEMINKVTRFLKHLPQWDVEDAAHPFWFLRTRACCLSAQPPCAHTVGAGPCCSAWPVLGTRSVSVQLFASEPGHPFGCPSPVCSPSRFAT